MKAIQANLFLQLLAIFKGQRYLSAIETSVHILDIKMESWTFLKKSKLKIPVRVFTIKGS